MPDLRVLALYPDLMNIYAETAPGLDHPVAPLEEDLERLAHLEARRAAGM